MNKLMYKLEGFDNEWSGIQYRNIAPGQQGFLWGSNSIGQDLWARIWARTSLTIAFFVAVNAAGITARCCGVMCVGWISA